MDPQTPSSHDGTPRAEGVDGADRGSAWAALDEAFFRIVKDTFTPTFRLGAEILLSSNDGHPAAGLIPAQPVEYAEPEAAAAPDDPAEAEARSAARRAAMRRHPSSWRPLH